MEDSQKKKLNSFEWFGIVIGIFFLFIILKACASTDSSGSESIYDVDEKTKKGFYEWQQKQQEK